MNVYSHKLKPGDSLTLHNHCHDSLLWDYLKEWQYSAVL